MLQIFEILDRFELLYPNNEKFADLRRLYIDRDWSSLFKLIENEELRKAILEQNIHSIFRVLDNKRAIGDVEDLRKAVVEQNLHSLFRLLPGTDDLRKAIVDNNEHSMFRLLDADELKKVVLDDNMWSLFRVLEEYTGSSIVPALKTLYVDEIEFKKDCLSRGQIKSKLWIIEKLKELKVDLGIVFLCAGWYGILATLMLDENIPIEKITTFDIDPSTEKIAGVFNKKYVLDDWKYKHCIQDINEINFSKHIFPIRKSDGTFEKIWEKPNTVINTSCEHISDFTKWYKKIEDNTLCIFQSNNYFGLPEHVNCYESLEEFSKSIPMTIDLYTGELDLGKYKRFMKIGFK